MLATRLAVPSGRLGDGDQLRGRPLARLVALHGGIIQVLAEPAGVLEELARRDPVGAWEVGEVPGDRGVEVEAALVGELQGDDGDERLGRAADVPRNIDVDGRAARVDGLRAGRDLGDRAVRFLQRDAGPDELTGGAV